MPVMPRVRTLIIQLLLKLKLHYFVHLMQRTDSLEKTWCWEGLRAGEEVDDRRWDGWMSSPTQWTRVWASSMKWWRTGKPGVLQSLGSRRVGCAWGTEQQKDPDTATIWQDFSVFPEHSPVCRTALSPRGKSQPTPKFKGAAVALHSTLALSKPRSGFSCCCYSKPNSLQL